MLPNRMNLTKQTEEHLKKLKQYTGIAPNVSSRIAFFRSIESGFSYVPQESLESELKLDGNLVLDKVTWMGDTQLVTEQLLKLKYPNLEGRALMTAWAAHVEDGIASIRNHKKLNELSTVIVTE
ncbi:DNA sulfur modification protein DndE [Shewanella colwelliana]|uniref:DNA sulfur modification protein DndE n=1 Tax=Shewanella colwelliana TaxID=23 RepID=UPI00299CE8CC|nr:DNA sulfur modification protein DndE [Shewanella colwelliana]MDX1282975.1 DNA sulfur modification protein DndE [Shewanella colwelliana]